MAAAEVRPAESRSLSAPLLPWMANLLRVAGAYNLVVGLVMLVFYHEACKIAGIPRPDPIMPLQLDGLLIGLFGVGYLMVARRPLANRGLLWLGFWSKLLGTLLCGYHVARGTLPLFFIPLVTVSDAIYLPPFYIIARRLDRMAADGGQSRRSGEQEIR